MHAPAGVATFGSLLRDFRLAAGLSQEALAERARISPQAVGALERGNRKFPYRETLRLLFQALSLDEEDQLALTLAATRKRLPTERTHSLGSTYDAFINVPRPLASFIGRQTELRDLAAATDSYRITTIIGPGGVGKTRLAAHFASEYRAVFHGGIWFVDLAAVATPQLVAPEIASTFGLGQLSAAELPGSIARLVGHRRSLIILDNCEQIIDEAARLAEQIAMATDDLAVLATSREPLKADGERRFALQTLDVGTPPAMALDPTAELPAAVALFAARAAAVDSSFEPGPVEITTIQRICSRLDGLPLAIELAAARAGEFSLSGLEQALGDRFSLLAFGRRTASPRQQTLWGLVDWSYQLLTPTEQAVFRRVAVFGGAFDAKSAGFVAAHQGMDTERTHRSLAELVAKSLITSERTTNGAERRFRLLETIREFARARLAELPEQATTYERLTDYVAMYVGRPEDSETQASEAARFAAINIEIENIRAALDWSVGSGGDVRRGSEIALALETYWRWQRTDEGTGWFETARQQADATDEALLARLDLAMAEIRPYLADSVSAALRASALYRRKGEDALLAEALRVAGHSSLNIRRPEKALPYLEEALTLAPHLDQGAIGRIRWSLGIALKDLGRFDEAAAQLHLAAEALVLTRHEATYAGAQIALSECGLAVGEYTVARQHARDALATCSKLGIEWLTCFAGVMEEFANWLADGDAGTPFARKIFDRAEDTRFREILPEATTLLGAIACSSGNLRDGAYLLSYADTVTRELGRPTMAVTQRLHDRWLVGLKDQFKDQIDAGFRDASRHPTKRKPGETTPSAFPAP